MGRDRTALFAGIDTLQPGEFEDLPDIQLWRLDGGKYFRLAFANGTEFCFDRQGERIFVSHFGKFDLEDVSIPLRGVVMGVDHATARAIPVSTRALSKCMAGLWRCAALRRRASPPRRLH